MTADTYEIRQCRECGLRYPLVEGHPFGESCPLCRGVTRLVLRRELVTEPLTSPPPPARGPDVQALLDNIRSAWNVGSIFRSADGFGISRLYLCGITPTPDHEGVAKTALGAERTIPWTHDRDPLEAARRLKAQGRQLWALETDERARALHEIAAIPPGAKIALVVGNEITGIDAELLDLCDRILYIPMRGDKRSFNVAVAFGIAAYALQAANGARS
jgi:23S rRNA (guanosine2251-2'-O)-methyltransferase